MISKQNCENVSILALEKNAGGKQLTIKTWHNLKQDFFSFQHAKIHTGFA